MATLAPPTPRAAAMDSMGNGEDPLDKASFDAVAYVNHHFPTERSLDRLDPFVVKVTAQISELDDHISRAVQAQSEAGQQAVRDVAEAKVAIRELFEKVRDIKSKAEQSEVMVQEICRDIRQLDYAKRHLQTTITALKRLHMLVTAVDQLQGVAAARQYREAANLLDAVRQLLTHFEGYAQVPRIAQLGATVAAIKADLSGQISRAFDAVGELAASSGLDDNGQVPLPASSGGGSSLSGSTSGAASPPGSGPAPQFRGLTEACLVVDALGVEARQKQIVSFCDRQLAPYGNLFPRGAEQSSLENVERRFAWFRRLLRSVDLQMDGVFPAHWRMQHRLCMSFLERTRAALLALLEAGGRECEDVQVLLKTLKRCLAFEREAQHRFEADLGPNVGFGRGSNAGSTTAAAAAAANAAAASAGGGAGAGSGEAPDIDEQGNLIDPASAEGIKRKYARQAEQRRRASAGEGPGGVAAPRSAFAALSKDGRGDYDEPEALPLLPIAGLLSGVFDPFMGPYIALERRNMDDLMARGVADDGVDRDGRLPVFAASVNIFAYIKNCIQRCTNLTTGQTFFNLHKEFKACLRAYAAYLRSKLPTPQPGAAGGGIAGIGGVVGGGAAGAGGGAAGGPGSTVRIPEGGEVSVCYVINTAEYCAEILPQLEEMIRSKIEPSYKDSVDLRGEQDAFFDVVAQAVRALVLGLEARLDPAMRALSAVPWGACEAVGEESAYVRLMNDAVAPFIPAVRAPLSTVYFRNFCDKFATSFLPSYLNVILRQRRINEMGTQQLLLDAYNVKTLMLKLPTLGVDAAAAATAAPVPVSYTKYVTKQMSKIEMVLKLVGTPDTMLAERFRIMWPDGGAGDLQAIMALKGMRKVDQQLVMDTLGFAATAGGGMDAGGGGARPGGGAGGGSSHVPSPPSPTGGNAQGANRLNMPKQLEQNTRAVARKMESSVRDLTQNIGWGRK